MYIKQKPAFPGKDSGERPARLNVAPMRDTADSDSQSRGRSKRRRLNASGRTGLSSRPITPLPPTANDHTSTHVLSIEDDIMFDEDEVVDEDRIIETFVTRVHRIEPGSECQSPANRLAKVNGQDPVGAVAMEVIKSTQSSSSSIATAPSTARRFRAIGNAPMSYIDSNHASDAPSPSSKPQRSSQNKGGKSNGKGAKSGRSRGHGQANRERDSPEPARLPLTPGEASNLKQIRSRQAELKRYYALIASQQKESFELITGRDISRLLNKPKAHTKCSEYHQVTDYIHSRQREVENLIREELKVQTQLAENYYQEGVEIYNARYTAQCVEAKKEHIRGAQGDILLLHKAHQKSGNANEPTNHTSAGAHCQQISDDISWTRGYASRHILDEKAMMTHLKDYDDEATGDAIDIHIIEPAIAAIMEDKAVRKAEEKQAALDALVSVVEDRLNDKHSAPAPAPPARENPQFALSRLADCAEYLGHIPARHGSVPMREKAALAAQNSTTGLPALAPGPTPASHTQGPGTPRKSISRRQKSISQLLMTNIKEEDSKSQSSSNASTPLAPLAPRMPPPATASTYHHPLAPSRPTHPPGEVLAPLASSPRGRLPLTGALHTSLGQSSPPPMPSSLSGGGGALRSSLPSIGHLRTNSMSNHILPPLSFSGRFSGPTPPPPPSRPASMFSPHQSLSQPSAAARSQSLTSPSLSTARALNLPSMSSGLQVVSPSAGNNLMQPLRPRSESQSHAALPPVGPPPLRHLSGPPPSQAARQTPSLPLTPLPAPSAAQTPVANGPMLPQGPVPQNDSLLPQSLSMRADQLDRRRPRGPAPLPSTLIIAQAAAKTRMGGPRREPGQITFTPAQTPDSDRFKPQPPPTSAPSYIPGQAVLRPAPAANSNTNIGTGKLNNTFVNAAPDANSRAQQAADAAKANASMNENHGAGPKGGRRLLLPKGK